MRYCNKPITVLIIPDKSYPLKHALLTAIFRKNLPDRGHAIVWLLQTLEKRRLGERLMLDRTEAYLFPIKSGKKGHNLSAILKNMIYFRHKGLARIARIVRERNVDIIMVRNDLEAAIVSLLVSTITGIPFVYYLGFPRLEAIAQSAQHLWPHIGWIVKMMVHIGTSLRDMVIRHADFVFTMSDYWRDTLIARLALSPPRVKALPFGFDTSILPERVSGERVRMEYNLGNHPTVLYLGSLTPSRNLTILADIVARIVARIPTVFCLILVGFNHWEYVPHLKKAFAEHGVVDSVRFAPPVPHERVPEFIKASDVGLSPIEPIPLYRVSSPAKLIEMMGMGCPVVASHTPEQKSIIETSKGGICVPFNADAMAQAVVHLLNNPQEAHKMGLRGRRFVERYRSFDALTDKVEEVFINLAANKIKG